jgi:hypothetical protein
MFFMCIKSRYEVYIEHQLANYQHVFIKYTKDVIAFITLYNGSEIQFQIIDLAKIA